MKLAFVVASVVSLTAVSAGLAQTIVSQGDVTNTTLAGHIAMGSDFFEGHFYTFNANAGDALTISATRLTFEMDPTINIVGGNMIGDSFNNGGVFSGYSVLAGFDDEVDHPGPWGDPLGNLVAPYTGLYTLFIYSNASLANPNGYDYTVTVAGSTYVPTPGAAAALGLGGLAALRRRRR